MESRITLLEEKLSFAEDLLDVLNQTVVRQQRQIDQLEQEVRQLRQQMQAQLPADEWGLRDQIPPHY